MPFVVPKVGKDESRCLAVVERNEFSSSLLMKFNVINDCYLCMRNPVFPYISISVNAIIL